MVNPVLLLMKQDVWRESRFSSENGSFCENNGFYVVNPVLGLKATDKIVFFPVKQDVQWYNRIH